MGGSLADLRAHLSGPGPAWLLVSPAGDALRADVRAWVGELAGDDTFPDGVVWLDAGEPYAWLRARWPRKLARAVAAADEWPDAVAGWCSDARALVVVEGGDAPLEGLAPGAATQLRVLWLPDAPPAPAIAVGWTPFPAPHPPKSEAFDPVQAPWPLAVFPAAFTARAARAVAGEVDLARLAAEGWLDRAEPGAWRLRRSARAFLRAHAPAGALVAALEAWSDHVWIDNQATHALARPDVTFEDVAGIWLAWWNAGWLVRYVRQMNAFTAWGRARAEQGRVRFWHRVFADLASAAHDEPSAAWLAVAVSRCESDLGRVAAAHAWIERGLVGLPARDPRRLTALLQAASVAFAAQDLPAAISAAQGAVATGEALDVPAIHRAPAYADLAFYRLLAGDPRAAEAPLRTAIDILRTQGVGQTLVNVLNTLAMLMIALDRPREAVEASLEAVERAEHERHADALPFVLHSAAVALLAEGRVGEAHDLALRALHAARPDAHATLTPLLSLTYERVRVRSGGAEVRRAVTTAVAGEGAAGFAPYAALLVAEALAARGDRAEAASLLDHLMAGDAEGHVRALAQSARAPLGRAAPRAAPDLPTHTTALLALLDAR